LDISALPKKYQPVIVSGERFLPLKTAALVLGTEQLLIESWVKKRRHFSLDELWHEPEQAGARGRWLVSEKAVQRLLDEGIGGSGIRTIRGARYLSVSRASNELGVNCRTLWGWVHKGSAPFGFALTLHRAEAEQGRPFISEECLSQLKEAMKTVGEVRKGWHPRRSLYPTEKLNRFTSGQSLVSSK
jgi:DNA-binding transcriptional regulator YiaG